MLCNVGDVITFNEVPSGSTKSNQYYVVLEENYGVPSKVIVLEHSNTNKIGMIFTKRRGWPVARVTSIPNPLSKLEMLIFSAQTGTID